MTIRGCKLTNPKRRLVRTCLIVACFVDRCASRVAVVVKVNWRARANVLKSQNIRQTRLLKVPGSAYVGIRALDSSLANFSASDAENRKDRQHMMSHRDRILELGRRSSAALGRICNSIWLQRASSSSTQVRPNAALQLNAASTNKDVAPQCLARNFMPSDAASYAI